jgi:hypothetical protein
MKIAHRQIEVADKLVDVRVDVSLLATRADILQIVCEIKTGLQL